MPLLGSGVKEALDKQVAESKANAEIVSGIRERREIALAVLPSYVKKYDGFTACLESLKVADLFLEIEKKYPKTKVTISETLLPPQPPTSPPVKQIIEGVGIKLCND